MIPIRRKQTTRKFIRKISIPTQTFPSKSIVSKGSVVVNTFLACEIFDSTKILFHFIIELNRLKQTPLPKICVRRHGICLHPTD